MGGITVDDFSSSVAYREIFGLGQQEGEQKGRQEGPARPKPLPSPCACLGIAAAP
jgi:predicted transposase YdaD